MIVGFVLCKRWTPFKIAYASVSVRIKTVITPPKSVLTRVSPFKLKEGISYPNPSMFLTMAPIFHFASLVPKWLPFFLLAMPYIFSFNYLYLYKKRLSSEAHHQRYLYEGTPPSFPLLNFRSDPPPQAPPDYLCVECLSVAS